MVNKDEWRFNPGTPVLFVDEAEIKIWKRANRLHLVLLYPQRLRIVCGFLLIIRFETAARK
jgi:hypothetical protein